MLDGSWNILKLPAFQDGIFSEFYSHALAVSIKYVAVIFVPVYFFGVADFFPERGFLVFPRFKCAAIFINANIIEASGIFYNSFFSFIRIKLTEISSWATFLGKYFAQGSLFKAHSFTCCIICFRSSCKKI